MIISQTPYRISLFGGGTDYPDWYLRHGGMVLSTTIDKYIYISCRQLPPFFEHNLRLVYSIVETVKSVADIQHPSARNVLEYLGISDGLEIHYDGDLPARSGMGSSSAFTVGLLRVLYKYKDIPIDVNQLAINALDVEQNIIGECVGSQDQINAAYGGFNTIGFNTDGTFTVNPVTISKQRKQQLNDKLMLFYTGIVRTAGTIAGTYVNHLDDKASQLNNISQLTKEAKMILQGDGPLDRLGELLHQSWVQKRNLSNMVTNERIDFLYQAGRCAGAIGGKLTGAGGGGMMLLYVPEKNQNRVREALSELLYIPFRFSDEGCRVIFDYVRR